MMSPNDPTSRGIQFATGVLESLIWMDFFLASFPFFMAKIKERANKLCPKNDRIEVNKWDHQKIFIGL
jgi:hypothetical protein